MADEIVSRAVEGAVAYEEPLVKAVERLAALEPLDYERARKDEAKRLGIRATVLDREVRALRQVVESDEYDMALFEPPPWPEPVDGDDLLDQLVGSLCRYVVMPVHVAHAVALWVVHTHGFESWQHTPRLGVTAPEKGCGKSTLLDVLSVLVPRGIKTENLSTATMFRAVDHYRPTLLIDEVDTFLRDNEELRGALNAGHAKGGRHLRCEGDDNRIRAFKTFAPAAMAGIGRLPETLADRSILIALQKRTPDEYVQDFRSDRTDHLKELASQCARFVEDNQVALRNAEPAMPPTIHNRQADNWRSLLSIADVAGGAWPERARDAAIRLTDDGADDTESIRVRLLADILEIFDTEGEDRLPSKQIVEHLVEMDDRPWAEFKRGKPFTVNQLSRLLKPFRVTSGTIRWGSDTAKGYKLEAFKDVFTRYLPSQNVTTSQATAHKGLSPIPKRHNSEDVTFRNPLKATAHKGCDVVAVRKGGSGAETSFSADSADAEERLAIMAIDGEQACIQCWQPVDMSSEHVPVAGNRALHMGCYDEWLAQLPGNETENRLEMNR